MSGIDDDCEARARDLQRLLTERGVTCYVHWDRSPWGVQVPLAADPDPHAYSEEYAPSLYVLTEGTETVAGNEDTWVWFGQLGNFPDSQQSELYDTWFRWIERHWSGAVTASIADMLVPLVELLKHGAKSVYNNAGT